MTKQKKSFFEKLTGIQKIDDESEVEINASSLSKKEIAKDDSYEFSSKNNVAPEETEEDFFGGDPDEIKEESGDDLKTGIEDDIVAPIIPPDPIIPPEKEEEDDEIGSDAEGQLTIDVYQTDKDIVIKSTIAGVKPENLDVDINSEMVTVKGKRTQDDEVDAENYYYQECYWGPFSRSIILPVEIVTEKAEATMKNGILTIRLPKMEVARTRKLQVRGF